jgi:hypothetical protein
LKSVLSFGSVLLLSPVPARWQLVPRSMLCPAETKRPFEKSMHVSAAGRSPKIVYLALTESRLKKDPPPGVAVLLLIVTPTNVARPLLCITAAPDWALLPNMVTLVRLTSESLSSRAAAAGRILAERHAIQRGCVPFREEAAASAASGAGVVADRDVDERQDVEVGDAAAMDRARVLVTTTVGQVEGRRRPCRCRRSRWPPPAAVPGIAVADGDAGHRRGAVREHVEHAIDPVAVDDRARCARPRDVDGVPDVEIAGSGEVLAAAGDGEQCTVVGGRTMVSTPLLAFDAWMAARSGADDGASRRAVRRHGRRSPGPACW